jgi:cytochrome b6-f complex iron-sulfur subunit
MADEKKLSVAEILAAARKSDSKSDTSAAATPAPAPAAEATAEVAAPAESKPAAAKPVAKPAAGGGAKLSVAEMLAAARAEKQGGAAPAAKAAAKPAAAEKPAAVKPAAKPAVTKAEAKPAAAAVGSNGPKDTGSILAAARATSKPGPMSKAEAARLAPEAKTSPKPQKPRVTVPPMPPKPDYAKPKPPAEAQEGRRGFLIGMLLGSLFGAGWTATSMTFGLWGLGMARFMFPNVLTEPPSKFKVGFPSDFAPGQVETKFIPQYGVWVVNYEYNGQPEIYALRSVCTHLGCTPNWLEGEQKFKCPCHGSGFYKDGINFEGPAPRPLERYAIRIADDGQLEIDKSKLFQEEIGQWSDPASYVAV